MAVLSNRLKSFLDQNGIAYETIHHRRDYTAQETAQDCHVPGLEFAKAVVIMVDGKSALAVVPAHHIVDERKLAHALGAGKVRLAAEGYIRDLFPDCELGAEPPFGNLYGLKTYLSAAMAGDDRVTFNSGTHEDVVRISMPEYKRLVQPEVLEFSAPRARD